jgi:hypothetical protein
LLNLENIREASMFPRDTDRYIPWFFSFFIKFFYIYQKTKK